MPSGTSIVDLGAANSAKYEPYVREFLTQGKECTYVPLDIENDSLVDQVKRAQAKFPGLKAYGIWGSFHHGDEYYAQIPGTRLFLSLGSIFYNGPDEVAVERCQNFKRLLRPDDCLIVGQDGPSGLQTTVTTDPYTTANYKVFFAGYFEAIHAEAGIAARAGKSWEWTSRNDKSKHYFDVVAKQDLVCVRYEGLVVEAGTTYRMFKSWKRDEAEIAAIS